MRQILIRTWQYLEDEPRFISSLITFIAAALALGALLNALAPAVLP